MSDRIIHWVITVHGWGVLYATGTEAQAEAWRAHKANWEQAIAVKRPAEGNEIKDQKFTPLSQLIMISVDDKLSEPFAACDCQCGGVTVCECGVEERALRAYAGGVDMPAMTAAQREWCLNEIDFIEGYRRSDYESSPDEQLANGVLRAWVDYCRDKGLL